MIEDDRPPPLAAPNPNLPPFTMGRCERGHAERREGCTGCDELYRRRQRLKPRLGSDPLDPSVTP